MKPSHTQTDTDWIQLGPISSISLKSKTVIMFAPTSIVSSFHFSRVLFTSFTNDHLLTSLLLKPMEITRLLKKPRDSGLRHTMREENEPKQTDLKRLTQTESISKFAKSTSFQSLTGESVRVWSWKQTEGQIVYYQSCCAAEGFENQLKRLNNTETLWKGNTELKRTAGHHIGYVNFILFMGKQAAAACRTHCLTDNQLQTWQYFVLMLFKFKWGTKWYFFFLLKAISYLQINII